MKQCFVHENNVVPQEMNAALTRDPATPLLHICSRRQKARPRVSLFIDALVTVAKDWESPVSSDKQDTM